MVSEALASLNKHSGATAAGVAVSLGGALLVRIESDNVGGLDRQDMATAGLAEAPLCRPR